MLEKQNWNFIQKKKEIDDGLALQEYHQVYCKMSGKINESENEKTVNKQIKLGFTTDYGVQDWTNVAMGLREFVSNAIDRTIREFDGKFIEQIKNGNLSIKVVDKNQVRAKTGYTRVFVPFQYEVIDFVATLGKRFLHFSEPENVEVKILPKKDRNINGKGAVVYRKGVYVREVETTDDKPSLYDYNFGDELKIDECRNVDDYNARTTIAIAIRNSNSETISGIFQKMINKERIWESSLDSYYLSADRVWEEEEKKSIKENWNSAWKKVAGDSIMVDALSPNKEILSKKGHTYIEIDHPSWTTAAFSNQLEQISTKVLSKSESAGKVEVPVTEFAIQAVDIVWGWLEESNMILNKTKPDVRCFQNIMENESITKGYYEDNVVYLREMDSTGGITSDLLQTALEEVVHHITGAGDMSRDIQDFLFQAIVKIKLEK